MKTSIQLTITALTFLILGIFISRVLIPTNGSSNNNLQCDGEEFMPFLQQFNSDVVFQKERTLFPLYYSTLGSKNDTVSYLLERADWVPLNIFETEGVAVVIRSLPGNPCTTTVTLQGVNSGEYAVFTFILDEGKWQLNTFEDYSD